MTNTAATSSLKLSALIWLAAISACSDSNSSSTTAVQSASQPYSEEAKVEKKIALKELTIGKSIKTVKTAKKLGDNSYMFEYPYFGGTPTFMAKTTEAGKIYEYSTTIQGSFDSLKSALEEKLSADNGRAVNFDCVKSSVKPDSSAEITTRICKVSGNSEILRIEEMKMQPSANYAGLPKVPSIVVSLKLEGTELATDANAAKQKNQMENFKKDEARKKGDV